MGNKKDTSKAASWFQSLKSEFNKIIWPDKEQLTKETAVVVVVSVILGIIIAILDMVLKYGINLLTK